MPKFVYFLFILFLYAICFPSIASEYPHPSQGNSGLFGYVDASGRFVIKPQFQKAMPFTEGIARVMLQQNWRLINEKGNFVTREAYEEISDFKNGLAVVTQKDNKRPEEHIYGLVNLKGKEVVSPSYYLLTPNVSNSLFIVGRKEKTSTTNELSLRFGVIDFSGKEIIPVRFTAIRDQNFKTFAVKNDQEQWQVFTSKGLPVFSGTYSDVKDFDEEVATIKQGGKWGIVARNGNVVVEPIYKDVIKKGKNAYDLVSFVQWKVVHIQKGSSLVLEYDHVKPLRSSRYGYQSGNKYGLLDEKGTPITEALFDDIGSFVKDLSIFRNNSLFGVVNQLGTVVLPAQYQAVVIDSSGSYIKAQQEGKWGVFSKSGKALTAQIYDEVRIQPYGLFNVRTGQLWYVLDASGHVFGTSSYDHISDFTNLYAVARSRGRAGVINSRGTWVIDPTFDSLRIVSNHVACYYSNGTCGFVNLITRQILLSADYMTPISGQLFRIYSQDKVGLWSAKGYEIIPAKFDYISNPGKDSLFSVYIDQKKGLINLQGRTILPPKALYQELHLMEEERVGVRINNKYGFIDRDGKLRIANRYDGIHSFSEGMAAINIRGRWGFVDLREELRVQPMYDEVWPFKKGISVVMRSGMWGFVNRKGEEIIKPQYDAIEHLATGAYLVIKSGKKGFVSESGKELFIPKYDEIKDLGNGLIVLYRNGKIGLANTQGYDVAPILHDYFYYNPENELYVLGMNPPVQNFVYSR